MRVTKEAKWELCVRGGAVGRGDSREAQEPALPPGSVQLASIGETDPVCFV